MKNVFLFLNAVLDRTLSFQIEYVLGIQIRSFILMAENHNTVDSQYFFANRSVCIYDKLQECIEHCDIIIASSEHMNQLKTVKNKEIIIIEANKGKYENRPFTIPNLAYAEKPVIAILSLGEFSDQYNTEILINKILTESGAQIKQHFSPLTHDILESCSRSKRLNTALSRTGREDENYDIIILSINGISSYPQLMKIICEILPDMILLCVNHAYSQEEELKKCLFGCGKIDVIIKSPYISYEIVKGKTFPVFCGHEKSASYYGSFENDLYEVLQQSMSKCVYWPKNIFPL